MKNKEYVVIFNETETLEPVIDKDNIKVKEITEKKQIKLKSKNSLIRLWQFLTNNYFYIDVYDETNTEPVEVDIEQEGNTYTFTFKDNENNL